MHKKLRPKASPESFKLILCMVFAIMLFSGISAVGLAFFDNATDGIRSAQALMANSFTASVGVLLGLVGGHHAARG